MGKKSLTAALLLSVAAMSTAPANGSVIINEVFVNPSGSDTAAEFIELIGTPGMKLDGYMIAQAWGGQNRFYPLGSIPPIPGDALRPEFDEVFSLDGMTLGANGILVLTNTNVNPGVGIYPTVLSDTNWRNWQAVGPLAVWNGPPGTDTVGGLENDGSSTFFLVRNRPGATQANPTNDKRWAKDTKIDEQLFTPVTDSQDGIDKDRWGDAGLDKGEADNLGGYTIDLRGATTDDVADDLEVVDEVSFEHDRGSEYDLDDRKVDIGLTSGRLQERRVHALDDPEDLNPDCLTRVDYRTKGPGWAPETGGIGEMGNGNNWQDTATEQWIRGDSVRIGSNFFYDQTAISPVTFPDAVQPYRTNVPLWLADGMAPDFDFVTANSYQIMAGRVNPLAVPFIPGDVDRDGLCDAADIAKMQSVFGNEDWIFSNSFAAAPEGDSGDPATQTRPWDVDLTGDNGIEASDLQWVLNFQGNTNGRVVGVRYDSTTPSATGIHLNSNAGVNCTVSMSASNPCGRNINSLLIGDTVEVIVRGRVTGGVNNTAGQQNGIMQFIHDIDLSSAGVLKVVNVAPLGAFDTTRAALLSPIGVDGDAGVHTVNGYATSFTQGLAADADLYRVTLQAIAAGSTNVAVGAATDAKFAASAPRGLKVGHTNNTGNPATTAYAAMIGITVTNAAFGDINGDTLLDTADIATFINVLLLNDLDPMHVSASDMNCDGNADGDDIQLLLDLLL